MQNASFADEMYMMGINTLLLGYEPFQTIHRVLWRDLGSLFTRARKTESHSHGRYDLVRVRKSVKPRLLGMCSYQTYPYGIPYIRILYCTVDKKHTEPLGYITETIVAY